MKTDRPSQSHRNVTETINEFLASKLPPNHNLLFQQDGATACTTVISMASLWFLFPQRVISHFGDVPWPPRSPDLTAPDFFIWGYLKSKACSGRTDSTVESRAL
jgi:hypothetical protein